MKYLLLICCCCLLACQDGQQIIIPDNNPTPYEGVATVKIENYLNRIYIDLLGREPLNVEVERDVAFLREGDLLGETREALINLLFTDTQGNDSSYQYIYYARLYEQSKLRMLEGISDENLEREIDILYGEFLKDSLNGNQAGMDFWTAKMQPLEDILQSQHEYRNGQIDIGTMYARMLNNVIYDQINMNSINFIRSCFDNLFFRLPTQAEFDQSFPIIENNIASNIFGQSASNKAEYIQIMVNSREFHEGMIRWAYKLLLAREPSSAEITAAMTSFYQDHDLQKVQRDILITDEYANF